MSWIGRLANTGYVGALALVERRIPFWPREAVERLQRLRLRSIVRHAYRTVPFYRQAMDDRRLHPADFQRVDDLDKLPLIDGLTVQRQREAYLSSRYREIDRQCHHTSGSQSQVHRAIYWDNGSVLRKLARAERDRVVLSRLVGRERGHRLYLLPAVSLSLVIREYWEANTLMPANPGGSQHLPLDLPYETVAERINQLRPAVVYSYGSYAEHFFRFLKDRRISLRAPRVWMVGGDMLSPLARDLIEREFGCLVYSTYQATETGRLGFQCEKRAGFHLNIDLCAVRVAGSDGNTLPAGEPGEVVVSNLHNRAMVLLNYRLGDRAALASSACSCGRSLPVLERLEGRCSEVLTLPDGRQITALALRMHCKHELDTVLQDQIVQPSADRILWRLVPFCEVDQQALRLALGRKVEQFIGSAVRLEVEFVSHIPFTSEGKFVGVVSQARRAGDEIG